MNGEKLKYTSWLYLCGILGLILGAVAIYAANEFTILGVFLLISAILFLFVKTEMTYLMYTGMWAIFMIFATYESHTTSIGGWFFLGYLIYKYFNFRKIFSGKKTYEKPYEETYRKEREVRTEAVPYYYRLIGVSKNSSLDEIKKAYRRLVMIYHPDVGADPNGDKKFKEIQKAYEVLSNPEKRAQYDWFEESFSGKPD